MKPKNIVFALIAFFLIIIIFKKSNYKVKVHKYITIIIDENGKEKTKYWCVIDGKNDDYYYSTSSSDDSGYSSGSDWKNSTTKPTELKDEEEESETEINTSDLPINIQSEVESDSDSNGDSDSNSGSDSDGGGDSGGGDGGD